MSYNVTVEAMPGNSAAKRIGDKSGLWRVVIEDFGSGSIIPRNPRRQIADENLQYEEAFEIANRIHNQLKGE